MTSKVDIIMNIIDSEYKAYLLGLISSSSCDIQNDKMIVSIKKSESDTLVKIRDVLFPKIPLEVKEDMININIKSSDISDCFLNNKLIKIPEFTDEKLKWHFLRGYFDVEGNISCVETGYPKCIIKSDSHLFLEYIEKNCTIKCEFYKNQIEWTGVNSLDFLAKIYDQSTIFFREKYRVFLNIANGDIKTTYYDRLPCFKWCRTIQNAPSPAKTRFSDTGYDLHLVKKSKVKGNVYYYDTGIQVQPENGYYFDLVGRSSISKSGWTLANNIGIIDCSYTGSIIVALVKTDPDAVEPTLPCRLVQIIPRRLILMDGIEVDSLDKTARGDGGFGSTNLI